ncbi:MAG: hypothetical protein ICV74_11510 [Thermoleophilia bacterium]|nr:hypothetical protein [Thermoleophilia bacterium]
MTLASCPSCGRALGQHDVRGTPPVCPHCGAPLTVSADEAEPEAPVERAQAAPPGREEGREEFAGEETAEGVRQEIREKEG